MIHTQEEQQRSQLQPNQDNPGDADKAATENMLKNLNEVVCTMNECMGISVEEEKFLKRAR